MEHKGYLIKPDLQMPSCVKVVTAGKGGSIPTGLQGMFTSTTEAMKKIDLYVANKGTKRGKASTTSRN